MVRHWSVSNTGDASSNGRALPLLVAPCPPLASVQADHTVNGPGDDERTRNEEGETPDDDQGTRYGSERQVSARVARPAQATTGGVQADDVPQWPRDEKRPTSNEHKPKDQAPHEVMDAPRNHDVPPNLVGSTVLWGEQYSIGPVSGGSSRGWPAQTAPRARVPPTAAYPDEHLEHAA
jgi:hypothetical protein